MCNDARWHYEKHFCEIILNLDQFKDISYLELWWLICSAGWNHLRIFGRVHHEEHFCEIILLLGQCI